MPRLVALYRALNVGRRRIANADLARLHEAAGLADVRTFLASGNVVFQAPRGGREALARRLEAAFAAETGFVSEVLLRDAEELTAAIEANPFLDGGRAPKLVHTIFLRDAPPAEAVQAARATHRGPEEWAVVGREVFVHYVDGSARSALDLSGFGMGTARNANTVERLLALVQG